jgi:perosamine synthetase
MMTHVLGKARDSGLFSAIHVSTESETIREVVANFGLPPKFMRPPYLACIGGYSLNYHKHIHKHDGGIAVNNDDDFADRLRLTRTMLRLWWGMRV